MLDFKLLKKKAVAYCNYYQAYVKRDLCWFFVAALRSFEHMALDRTIHKEKSLFEFYVPADCELEFIDFMSLFEKNGIVTCLVRCSDRRIGS